MESTRPSPTEPGSRPGKGVRVGMDVSDAGSQNLTEVDACAEATQYSAQRIPVVGPFLVLALSLPVEISGEGDCPSPVAVAEQLEPLLAPRASDAPPPEQVKLSRREGRVVVELVAGSGEAAVVREIDGDARCADLARAVAVIVAAWQLERHPELRKEEPAPRKEPAPRPSAQRPLEPRPEPVVLRFDLGLGAAVALDDSGASPAGAMRASIAGAAGWGMTLWGAGPRGRTEPLLDGSVEWYRPMFAAALLRRVPLASGLDLDLSVGPSVAWVRARATDLPEARGVSSWSPGATAGASVSYGGSFAGWLAIDAITWPRPTRLVVDPGGATLTLPTWEIWVGVGALWRWPWNGGRE
jgi:hypothetical protein